MTEPSFLIEVTILVLAIFLGFEVISKVPPLLVGAILVAGQENADTLTRVVGFAAVVLGTANVVGGFMVTDRMLELFKRKPSERKPQ